MCVKLRFVFVSIKWDVRLNPSATPPSTKDESAFLAGILVNKAFSPLIPGTRSSRGNHNAIRGPQASWAKELVTALLSGQTEQAIIGRRYFQIQTGNIAMSPTQQTTEVLTDAHAFTWTQMEQSHQRTSIWAFTIWIYGGVQSRLGPLFQQHLRNRLESSQHHGIKALFQSCNIHPQITQPTQNHDR